MPDHDPNRDSFASTSLAAHLARGALGFGLLAATLALTPSLGARALLLAPLGLVALRGCPTCWTVGLIQTISAGRLERTCAEDGAGCTLRRPPRPSPMAATTAPKSATATGPRRSVQAAASGAGSDPARDPAV